MADRPYWWGPDSHGRRGAWRPDWDEERYHRSREREIQHMPDRPREDDHDYDLERYGYTRHRHEGRGRDERSDRDWTDRATDEVKSWFGSERAERRREMDHARERRREQERRDFSGVGPRMRHEEDDDLRDAINRRLAEDPRLDASGILVRVVDNEAILDGVVASERDGRWAREIASDVPGVVHVRDRMRADRRALERAREQREDESYYDEDYPRRPSYDERRRWS